MREGVISGENGIKVKEERYSHWGSYGGLKDSNSGKNKY